MATKTQIYANISLDNQWLCNFNLDLYYPTLSISEELVDYLAIIKHQDLRSTMTEWFKYLLKVQWKNKTIKKDNGSISDLVLEGDAAGASFYGLSYAVMACDLAAYGFGTSSGEC